VATTSSPADLAVRLRLAVTRTARRLRREAGGDLSPSLSAALATIERHGPLAPSELAAREGIQRPAATRIVDRLAEVGLVARTPDPADRRSCRVAATPEGEELIAALRTRKDAFLADRLAGLDPADRRTLERAAELLEELLEAR
jgi:DNA-binding MarR family transcriptional regulator